MNSKKNFIAVFSLALIICMVLFLWFCELKKVGPDISSEVKTEEILAKLANAQTQEEAENAIKEILVKTGVGNNNSENEFKNYTIGNEYITMIADAHMNINYIEDQVDSICLLTLKNIIDFMKNDFYKKTINYSNEGDILNMLTKQAISAKLEPEKQNNAFILTIGAENGVIPDTFFANGLNTVIMPIQAVFFTIWFDRTIINLEKRSSINGWGYFLCRLECFGYYLLDLSTCAPYLIPPVDREGLTACRRWARNNYRKCVEDCHDQGSGGL